MPRPRNTIPKYCTDKNGRAFTKVDGRFFSLGRSDDPESRQKYAAILQRLARGQPVENAKPGKPKPVLSCNELALGFMLHAAKEYTDRVTGKPSAEVACYNSAVKHLRELYGETPAGEMGPNSLRTIRERMIGAGWSRGYINKSIGRIRHIWRWGVSRELVPSGVLEGLTSLEPLKAGKSAARETKRRRAIPLADIEAMKKKLKQRNRDIVDLLYLTGARPGEILGLTTALVQSRETVSGVWVIDLEIHKTSHHGHERKLYINAAAQQILVKYLRLDAPDERLFPVQRETLGAAVKSACVRAGVPVFTPHYLRHTSAAAIADASGTEAAQRVLGHANINMTSHYSASANRQAVEAVRQLG